MSAVLPVLEVLKGIAVAGWALVVWVSLTDRLLRRVPLFWKPFVSALTAFGVVVLFLMVMAGSVLFAMNQEAK